jgi:hypothetical protein
MLGQPRPQQDDENLTVDPLAAVTPGHSLCRCGNPAPAPERRIGAGRSVRSRRTLREQISVLGVVACHVHALACRAPRPVPVGSGMAGCTAGRTRSLRVKAP